MANINRYMVPAEIPQPSFFQLPYDQMKEAILSAQQQQDTAKEGLSQIGDISFNYLTNSKVDPELAKNVYGELDSKVGNVLSQQDNGDLRGLRGEIYNLGKEVGRWYKPDGKIGRLQSNYLQYNDWYKRQVENKDLDPKYVQDAAKTIMSDYDARGGANAGGIYTEDLKKHFDYSKFVNDNKDMIKSTIIERERDRLGNNGYKYTDEQLQKFITPEKIMYTLSEILQSNPDHLSSLQQRIRFGNLPKESQSTLIQTGKDSEGKPIYGLNPYSPAASAIQGAMTGLGGIEEDRQRFSIGTDEPWLAFWRRQNEKEDAEKEQALITTKDFTQGYTQDAINALQNNFDGSPESIEALQNATAGYREVITKNFLNPDGTFKKEVAPYFEGVKDVNGNIIDPKDILKAYTMAAHNPKGNLGNGIWINEDVMRSVLESEKDKKGNNKYKLNWTLDDGLFKKVSSLANGLAGYETDIPQINDLGYDMGDFRTNTRVPSHEKAQQQIGMQKITNKMFDDLREYERKQKQTGSTSSQDIYYVLDPKTKNGVGQQLQSFDAVSKIASGFNFVDKESGKTGSLSDFIKDNSLGGKDVVTAFSSDNNGNNPGGLKWTMTFNKVDENNKVVGTKEVAIKPKTAAMLNQMEALASEALYRTNAYTQQQPSIDSAGIVARTNIIDAINNTANDQNINAFTKLDSYASTILSIPVGKVGIVNGKTFKKLSTGKIQFIEGPTVEFSSESDLKRKLNTLK